MRRGLDSRLRRLEKRLKVDLGETAWIVETDFKDHWRPIKHYTNDWAFIESKPIMNLEEYTEFASDLSYEPLAMPLHYIERLAEHDEGYKQK